MKTLGVIFFLLGGMNIYSCIPTSFILIKDNHIHFKKIKRKIHFHGGVTQWDLPFRSESKHVEGFAPQSFLVSSSQVVDHPSK